MQLRNRFRAAAFLIVGGWVFGATPAAAHAIILAARPATNAIVHGPSLAVELRFNSRLDPERSRLMLVVTDGSAKTLALLTSERPDALRAEINDLQPGHYRLRWQVLALDGHITRGDIPFTVVP